MSVPRHRTPSKAEADAALAVEAVRHATAGVKIYGKAARTALERITERLAVLEGSNAELRALVDAIIDRKRRGASA